MRSSTTPVPIFCEEVQNLLLTSSVHEDQNNGNGMLPNDGDSGISAGRNCMTQSLMKVEEEMPSGQQAYMTKDGKPLRSSSVSPRPVTTAISHSKPIQTNSLASNDSVDSIEQHRNKSSTTATPSFSRTTEIKQQTRLSRPTTSHRSLPSPRQSAPVSHGIDKQHVVVNTRVPNPKAQLLHNLISVPLENKEQPDRNRNVNSVTDAKNSCPTFGNYPPSKTQSEIPDLAALREIARQQEQALRQANETNSKSPYSSASSLVSSKSADMSTLHKTNANVTSRIPSCTRVPKKSGIPTPSRRAGVPVRCASVAPQPTTNDDECF
ncbi:hypothetical protein KIN20_009154 [Parelaphostrongylus tenuis]|uniref:Uncharacterized protein n=1 Tax=Parelaphostrongylus tenuis TaxID=148309 RepID=A0AAD5QL35_PARTN|nr:hypothetical protein KIN20_009154 [Parelaphostrongylus tenuis]